MLPRERQGRQRFGGETKNCSQTPRCFRFGVQEAAPPSTEAECHLDTWAPRSSASPEGKPGSRADVPPGSLSRCPGGAGLAQRSTASPGRAGPAARTARQTHRRPLATTIPGHTAESAVSGGSSPSPSGRTEAGSSTRDADHGPPRPCLLPAQRASCPAAPTSLQHPVPSLQPPTPPSPLCTAGPTGRGHGT